METSFSSPRQERPLLLLSLPYLLEAILSASFACARVPVHGVLESDTRHPAKFAHVMWRSSKRLTGQAGHSE